MSSSSTNFLLSAANVSWGRRERNCVTAIADVGGALDGLYFNIDAPASVGGASSPFYVWVNVDAGGNDPTPVGRVGIPVAISTGDSAIAVALAIQTALEAQNLFRAKISPDNSATVIVDSEFIGLVTDPATDVDSGFTFEQAVPGIGGDLGKTNGGIEVSIESGKASITADQSGGSEGLVLDQVLLGQKVSVSMTLIEMTQARWKAVVGGVTGDTYTPSGGNELVGFGESRLYDSLFDLGGELVLHPTRKAANDKLFDITLFKAAPLPASLNFSPDEVQGMEISFDALADRDVQAAINLMAFGDSSQDVRA